MRRSICVNTRLLLKDRLEGIGVFGHEVLKRMCVNHPDVDFHFFFDRPYDRKFIYAENVTGHVLHPQARHPVLFYLWFEWAVKAKMDELKPDLFLSIDGFLSLRSKVPQLAVIHDIYFEHHPEIIPFLVRKYYHHFFPRFAKKASRIATVSEFSKQDIHSEYGIEKDKMDVVYNGSKKGFKPLSEESRATTRLSRSGGSPYLIYVGALQPRKNISSLIQAFDRFKKTHPGPMKLLLTGEKKWWSAEQQQVFSKLKYKSEILFTGRLDQEELQQVMASAEGLVYVSIFEGFGIPILEAMSCDIPVLTSKVTSMPEVGGDAVIYCDPYSIDSITEGMVTLVDQSKREKLIEKARIQREKFSWEQTSELLWSSIEKAIDQ